MAKKKVDVNEEMLKDIMIGDIPVFGREKTEDKTEEDKGTEPELPPATGDIEVCAQEKVAATGARKKRGETGDYRKRFLVNVPASNRSHVYINREVAECIKRVLPVIAPGMSISGYISNILVDHMQQHWDDINELYNKEYYKPLKPFQS